MRCRQQQPLGMVSSGPRRDGRMNGQTCRHLWYDTLARRRPDPEIAALILVPSDRSRRRATERLKTVLGSERAEAREG